MIRRLVLAGLLSGLGGCANFDQVVQALGKDQNAVCLRVVTLYGSFVIDRNHGCEPATVVAAVSG